MLNATKPSDTPAFSMFLTTVLARWRVFVGASPLRRLGHDALVAAGTSLAARGVGFAKEIVVAAHFGLSGNLDVYFVAFTLIGFPLAILLNAVQTAFIARLSGNISEDESKRLYGLTAAGTLLILLLLLPLWLLFVPHALPWLASGFAPEKRQALETALLWLVPYYFLNGLNLLGYGVLQAKRRYLQNGLLPAATPLVIMLTLLVIGAASGWHILAAALVAGTATECVLLLMTLSRLGCIGLPHLSGWRALKPVLANSLALLPGTAIGSLVVLVEQAIAASLGEGSNAALLYGYRLPAALQSLFVTAIGITALPYFAAQIAQRQHDYCLHSLKRLFWILGVGGMLIAFPLVIFSPEITALLYQRGAFNAAAVARVVPIQNAYFIQIPFALLAMLGIKTLAALGRNTQVSLIVATAAFLQGTLAYFLARQLGAPGIAWAATTISALIAATAFFAARAVLKQHTP